MLIPNIAAEEGAVWEATRGEETVRDVARLWRLLFGPDARLAGVHWRAPEDQEAAFEGQWPEVFGVPAEGSVFGDLDRGDAFAWLHTVDARTLAKRAGCALAAPDPLVVQRVHDKAFALRWAHDAGEEPEALRACSCVFGAEELRERPDAVLQAIREQLDAWPAWLGRRFTLKPRFGSSGRGRVAGKEELSALRAAFPRLAERGGAILEPWLDRVRDLSAQFWIEPGGVVRLLGTLELLVTPAGLYRGHRGSVDNRGRVTSMCPEDEPLREVGAQLAAAAAQEGFSGPCGVDAFSFRGPAGEQLFRPIVEFNGRFTMGTIAIGLLRRALPVLRRVLPRDASERRAFHFALVPPESGEWPSPASTPSPTSPGWVMLPLGPNPSEGPGLLVASDPGHLEMAFQAQATAPILSH